MDLVTSKKSLQKASTYTLHMAFNKSLENNDITKLKFLIKEPCFTPYILNVWLIEACIQNKPKFIKRLLKSGADPEAFDSSALHWALESRCSLEIIRLLLQHGAKPYGEKGGESIAIILEDPRDEYRYTDKKTLKLKSKKLLDVLFKYGYSVRRELLDSRLSTKELMKLRSVASLSVTDHYKYKENK